MAEPANRVRVDEVDWPNLLPFLRLFGACRLAVHPTRLLLGLVLLAGLGLLGRATDGLSSARVYDGEFEQYAQRTSADFDRWVDGRDEWSKLHLERLLGQIGGVDLATREALVSSDDRFDRVTEKIRDRYEDKRLKIVARAETSQADEVELRQLELGLREQLARDLAAVDEIRPRGVYHTTERVALDAGRGLLGAAAGLRLGLDGVLDPSRMDQTTVVGALHELLVLLPGWLCRVHPWFGLFYALLALAWGGLIGGAIARMVALEATRDEPASLGGALRFAWTRWAWFFLTPVLPMVVVAAIGLALAVGGLVFFNAAVLDLVGGALFFLALGCGAAMAVLVVLQAAGAHLYFPAIAVEGTDSFDALTRSFGYVVGRPWRWLVYTSIALVYGAVTYLIAGVLVLATLWMTHKCVGLWVRDVAPGVSRFEAMMPAPQLGDLRLDAGGAGELTLWSKPASGLVSLWVHAAVGLLGAYMVSYYFSAGTWVYLLLRRSADGVEFDDVYVEPRSEPGVGGGEDDAAELASSDAGGAKPVGQPPDAGEERGDQDAG